MQGAAADGDGSLSFLSIETLQSCEQWVAPACARRPLNSIQSERDFDVGLDVYGSASQRTRLELPSAGNRFDG
jgi:hypothetical protein